MKEKIIILASPHLPLIDHELKKIIDTNLSMLKIIIKTEEDGSIVRLQEKLLQPSIWGDKYLIITEVNDKNINILLEPWVSSFINNNLDHKLIIKANFFIPKSHKINQHNFNIKNIYPKEISIKSNELDPDLNDDNIILKIQELKSTNPSKYIEWINQYSNAEPYEKKHALEEYLDKNINNVFITWVDCMLKNKSMDKIKNLSSSERIECFYMISSWLNQNLIDYEKNNKNYTSGFMKWPQTQTLWNKWSKNNIKNIYIWYYKWIILESGLKGQDYPITPDLAWHKCIQLIFEVFHKINPDR